MRSLKLYIASSFDEKTACQLLKEILEKDHGHSVPDVWWNVDEKARFKTDAAFYSDPMVRAIAARHWATIRDCDAVILVGGWEDVRRFTGANVEVGFAIALNKPVFVLGKVKRSAMYSPGIFAGSNLDTLCAAVNCLANDSR